jgi:ribulose-5-phosphate 4-epimerase/fuculose-1-phosphate aldolase
MATVLERPVADVRPSGISDAEWKTRVDLAAFYRIAAIYNFDDFLYTHISARVPGPDHHFLINPFGLTFDEITASSLVKVDLEGNIIGESAYGINYAGYIIHSAIHAAREDATWIAHFHTRDGMGASAHAEGLLPLTQRALYIIPQLAYHDYEGVALHKEERERLQADLGPVKKLALLRNHGTLALGSTPGEAWFGIYQLEAACSAQVAALAGGREHVLFAPDFAIEEAKRQLVQRPAVAAKAEGVKPHYELAWEAVLRKVARTLPGFDA